MRHSRVRRLNIAVLGALIWLLAIAPAALAATSYGQGTYGETNDQVVTNAGFLVIAFFPALVFVLSVVQSRLEKRKHARMAAAKHRLANAQWRGGW